MQIILRHQPAYRKRKQAFHYDQLLSKYYDIMTQLIENHHDWQELDNYFYPLIAKEHPDIATCINKADLSFYQEALAKSYQAAMQCVQVDNYAALYIEFNPENLWTSLFCLSTHYLPKHMLDDDEFSEDWACSFDKGIDGPNFEDFSRIYNECAHESPAIQAYLIARCFACLGRIYSSASKKDIAICVACHDCDIIRIQEYLPPLRKLYDVSLEPTAPQTESLSLQDEYVIGHYSHLMKLYQHESNRKQQIKKVLFFHRDNILFNYCPFCGKLRRTPTAKQCPHCFKRE